MDALLQLETLLTRVTDRARGAAEVAEATAARDSLAVVKSGLEQVRQERQHLSAEVLQLRSRITVLEQEIALLKKTGGATPVPVDQLIEHLGAVFVRKPGGRILDQPHCRQCQKPLKAIAPDMPFSCPACQIFALFRPSELSDVLLTLQR